MDEKHSGPRDNSTLIPVRLAANPKGRIEIRFDNLPMPDRSFMPATDALGNPLGVATPW